MSLLEIFLYISDFINFLSYL